MYNLKIKQINEYNKTEIDSDIENKLMVTSGKSKRGRGKVRVRDYEVQVKVTQSCLTLWTPWDLQSIDFSRPEYWSEWFVPFSRGSSQPRIEPRSRTLHADSLPAEPQGKPKNTGVGILQRIFPTRESNLVSCIPHRFFSN